jgi:hypothetical protein
VFAHEDGVISLATASGDPDTEVFKVFVQGEEMTVDAFVEKYATAI